MASTPESVVSLSRRDSSLTADIVTSNELDTATIRAMYELYAASYADTSYDRFRRDLDAKTHVLLLTHGGEILRGFTTLQYYSSDAPGYPVRVLFSGDTVIEPAYWGNSAWALEWIRFAGTLARRSGTPLYWLLIVKGHRTYRFLPAFARRYIPHHKLAGTADDRTLLAALAREKFGDSFDPASGIVRFPTPQGRLNGVLADVPDRHRRLPSVAHFLQLNPGYREGNELVCLCELSRDNLRPLAARAFSVDSGRAN